jgi:hypothetical protein
MVHWRSGITRKHSHLDVDLAPPPTRITDDTDPLKLTRTFSPLQFPTSLNPVPNTVIPYQIQRICPPWPVGVQCCTCKKISSLIVYFVVSTRVSTSVSSNTSNPVTTLFLSTRTMATAPNSVSGWSALASHNRRLSHEQARPPALHSPT